MSENKPITSLMPACVVRTMSLVLALCILVGDPTWASGISDFYHAHFSSDLRDLSVPARLGAITDRFEFRVSSFELKKANPLNPKPETRNPKLVVLIQDLHANIGVQKNIAGVIEHLYNRFGISRVYTEAAFGRCEVSLFRSLPSRAARNRLLDRLLSKALLSGSEIGAIRAGRGWLSPIQLAGVDDPALYLANVQAFRDVVGAGPRVALDWREVKSLLLPGATPELRRHLDLTEKLLAFKLLDQEWEQYKAHREWTPARRAEFRVSGFGFRVQNQEISFSPSTHNGSAELTVEAPQPETRSTALAAAIAAAERFYTAAEARNGAMAENLLSQMGSRNVSGFGFRVSGFENSKLETRNSKLETAVLVTGGFHTRAITQRLKQEGISYVVVTPQVDRLDHEELYVRSLTEPPHETLLAKQATDPQMKPSLREKVTQTRGLGPWMWRWLTGREKATLHEAKHDLGGPVQPKEAFWGIPTRLQTLKNSLAKALESLPKPSQSPLFRATLPLLAVVATAGLYIAIVGFVPAGATLATPTGMLLPIGGAGLAVASKRLAASKAASGEGRLLTVWRKYAPVLPKIIIILLALNLAVVTFGSEQSFTPHWFKRFVFPIIVALSISVVHNIIEKVERTRSLADNGAVPAVPQNAPSLWPWATAGQVHARLLKEFGLTDDQLAPWMGLSQDDLSRLTLAQWLAYYQPLRAANKQAFEALPKHRGKSVLGLIEIPQWYSALPTLGQKVLYVLPLVIQTGYHLLHAFFFRFYQQPMAYEWFGEGRNYLALKDPGVVERIVKSAARELQGKTLPSGYAIRWAIHYALDKTIVFKSTFLFATRRVHMAVLHTFLELLPMAAFMKVNLFFFSPLVANFLHVVGIDLSGVGLLTVFLMSVALNFGVMFVNYLKAYAVSDQRVNPFRQPQGSVPLLAALNVQGLEQFLKALEPVDLTPDQAQQIDLTLRDMHRKGLFHRTGILGFFPNRGEKTRVEELLFGFEEKRGLAANARTNTPFQFNARTARRELHQWGFRGAYVKSLGWILALTLSLGTLGVWQREDTAFRRLHRAHGTSIALGALGQITVNPEIKAATFLGEISHTPFVEAAVEASEKHALGVGKDILDAFGIPEWLVRMKWIEDHSIDRLGKGEKFHDGLAEENQEVRRPRPGTPWPGRGDSHGAGGGGGGGSGGGSGEGKGPDPLALLAPMGVLNNLGQGDHSNDPWSQLLNRLNPFDGRNFHSTVYADSDRRESSTPSPLMGEGRDGGDTRGAPPPTPALPHKGGGDSRNGVPRPTTSEASSGAKSKFSISPPDLPIEHWGDDMTVSERVVWSRERALEWALGQNDLDYILKNLADNLEWLRIVKTGALEKDLNLLKARLQETGENLDPKKATTGGIDRKSLGVVIKGFSEVPAVELRKAVQIMRESWQAQLRSADKASTVMTMLQSLEQFATQLEATQNQLKALYQAPFPPLEKAGEGTEKIALTPDESQALVKQLKILLRASWDLDDRQQDFRDLAPLFNQGPEFDQLVERVQAAMNAGIMPLLISVKGVHDASINWKNRHAQGEGRKDQGEFLDAEIKKGNKNTSQDLDARYRKLTPADREVIAANLGKTVSDKPLPVLVQAAKERLDGLSPDPSNPWRVALENVYATLTTLQRAQEEIRQPAVTQDRYIRSLSQAIQAIHRMESSVAAFSQTDKDYSRGLRHLSLDLAQLSGSSLAHFNEFKMAWMRANPDDAGRAEDATTRRIFALWYGTLFHEITIRLSPLKAMEGAQDVINVTDRLLNLNIEHDRLAADAELKQQGIQTLGETTIPREKDRLEKLKTQASETAERAEIAEQRVPTASAKEPVRIKADYLKRYADRLDKVSIRYKEPTRKSPSPSMGEGGDGGDARGNLPPTSILPHKGGGGLRGPTAQELQNSLDSLKQEVRSIASSLQAPEAPLTPQQSVRLEKAIYRVLGYLPFFIDDRYVDIKETNRKNKQRDQTFDDIKDVMYHAAYLAGRLAGLSDERLKQGVSGFKTTEDQMVAAFFDMADSPKKAYLARLNAREIHKNSRLLNVYFLLNVVNEAYGITKLKEYFAVAANRPSKWLVQVTRESNPVPVEDGPPTGGGPLRPPVLRDSAESGLFIKKSNWPQRALGGANLAVNALGAAKEIYTAVTGEMVAYAVHLDGKAFGKLQWQVIPNDAKEAQGSVRITPSPLMGEGRDGGETRGNLPPTSVLPHKGGGLNGVPIYIRLPEGMGVLKAENPRLKVEDITQRWKRDDIVLDNQPYTFVGGERYVWMDGKKPFPSRVWSGVKGTIAGTAAVQISEGLLKSFADHLVKVPASPLVRGLAVWNGLGVLAGGGELFDALDAKIKMKKDGGWVPAKLPKVIGSHEIDGTPVRILENGQVVYVRYELDKNGKVKYEVWEDAKGTPLYTRGGGRRIWYKPVWPWKFMRHADEVHLTSNHDAQKSARNLTEAFGNLFVRSEKAAPVLFKPSRTQGQPDVLVTQVPGDEAFFELGHPVESVLDTRKGPQKVRVRPFHLPPDIDPTESLVGVVVLGPDGQIVLDKHNPQAINYKSVYTYEPSWPEKLQHFFSLGREGQWMKLNPNLQGRVVMAELEPILARKGRWTPSLDGRQSIYWNPKGDKMLFVQWWDDRQKLHVLDFRDPARSKHYRLEGNREISMEGTSIRSLAMAKDPEGDWFKEARQDIRNPWNAPGSQFAYGLDGQGGARVWLDAAGNMRVYVAPGKEAIVGGIHFTEGTWLFGPGFARLQREAQQTQQSLFWKHNTAPLRLDLDAMAREGKTAKEDRQGPRGKETWYYFNQLRPGKSPREFIGGYVRYGEGEKAQVDYINPSLPGLHYLTRAQAGDVAYWSPRLVLPQTLQGKDMSWYGGDVPPLIVDHLRRFAPGASAKAEYAWDPKTQDFFLRITVKGAKDQDETAIFQNQSTEKGLRKTIEGLEQKDETFWIPLPTTLPDALMERLPLTDTMIFKKFDNRWHFIKTSLEGLTRGTQHRANDFRFFEALNEKFTLKDLEENFLKRGKVMLPASKTGKTVKIGGVQFRAYTNPTDPTDRKDHRIYTIFEAVIPPSPRPAGGERASPTGGRGAGEGSSVGGISATPHPHPLPLRGEGEEKSDGEVVFVDPWTKRVHKLKSGQLLMFQVGGKLIDAEMKTDATLLLQPANRSIAQIQEIEEVKGASASDSHLPRILPLPSAGEGGGEGGAPHPAPSPTRGEGKNVVGQWYQKKVPVGEKLSTWQWTYFEAKERGSYKDPLTQQEVTLEPGDVVVVDYTQKGDELFLAFHQSIARKWSLSLVDDFKTLQWEYAERAKERGIRNGRLTRGIAFTLPGTTISGHLLEPVGADPYAPMILMVDIRGGKLKDPLLGKEVEVPRGAVVIRQPSSAYQQKLLEAGRGAIALLLGIHDDSIRRIAGSFNSPELGGIIRVQDLAKRNPAAAQALQLPPKALIRVDAHFKVEGQISLERKGLEWLAKQQTGWGYIQMMPGRHTVGGKTLAGWEALTKADQDWLEDHMEPTNGKNGKMGWDIVNDKKETVGVVIFGKEAGEWYWDKTVGKAKKMLQEALNGPPYGHPEDLHKVVIGSFKEKLADGAFEYKLYSLDSKNRIVEDAFTRKTYDLSDLKERRIYPSLNAQDANVLIKAIDKFNPRTGTDEEEEALVNYARSLLKVPFDEVTKYHIKDEKEHQDKLRRGIYAPWEKWKKDKSGAWQRDEIYAAQYNQTFQYPYFISDPSLRGRKVSGYIVTAFDPYQTDPRDPAHRKTKGISFYDDDGVLIWRDLLDPQRIVYAPDGRPLFGQSGRMEKVREGSGKEVYQFAPDTIALFQPGKDRQHMSTSPEVYDAKTGQRMSIQDLYNKDPQRIIGLHPLLTIESIEFRKEDGLRKVVKAFPPGITENLKIEKARRITEWYRGEVLLSRAAYDPLLNEMIETVFDEKENKFEKPLDAYILDQNGNRKEHVRTYDRDFVMRADKKTYRIDSKQGDLRVFKMIDLKKKELKRTGGLWGFGSQTQEEPMTSLVALDPNDIFGIPVFQAYADRIVVNRMGQQAFRLNYSRWRTLPLFGDYLDILVRNKQSPVAWLVNKVGRFWLWWPAREAGLSFSFGGPTGTVPPDKPEADYLGADVRPRYARDPKNPRDPNDPKAPGNVMIGQDYTQELARMALHMKVNSENGARFTVTIKSGVGENIKSVLWAPPSDYFTPGEKEIRIPLAALADRYKVSLQNIQEVRINFGENMGGGVPDNEPGASLLVGDFRFDNGDVMPFDLLRAVPLVKPFGYKDFFTTETFTGLNPLERTSYVFERKPEESREMKSIAEILGAEPDKLYKRLIATANPLGTDIHGRSFSRRFEKNAGNTFVDVRDANGRLAFRRNFVTIRYQETVRMFQRDLKDYTYHEVAFFDPDTGLATYAVGKGGEEKDKWKVTTVFEQKILNNGWIVAWLKAQSLKDQKLKELPWQQPNQVRTILIDPHGMVRWKSKWAPVINGVEGDEAYFDAAGKSSASADKETDTIMERYKNELKPPAPWPRWNSGLLNDKREKAAEEIIDLERFPIGHRDDQRESSLTRGNFYALPDPPWHEWDSHPVRRRVILIAFFILAFVPFLVKALFWKTKKFLPKEKFVGLGDVIPFKKPESLKANDREEWEKHRSRLKAHSQEEAKFVKEKIRKYIQQLDPEAAAQTLHHDADEIRVHLQEDLEEFIDKIFFDYQERIRREPQYRFEENPKGSALKRGDRDPNGLWMHVPHARGYYEPVHDPLHREEIPDRGRLDEGIYQYPLQRYVWETIIRDYVLLGLSGIPRLWQYLSLRAMSMMDNPNLIPQNSSILSELHKDVVFFTYLLGHQTGNPPVRSMNYKIQGEGIYNPDVRQKTLKETDDGYLFHQRELGDWLRYHLLLYPDAPDPLDVEKDSTQKSARDYIRENLERVETLEKKRKKLLEERKKRIAERADKIKKVDDDRLLKKILGTNQDLADLEDRDSYKLYQTFVKKFAKPFLQRERDRRGLDMPRPASSYLEIITTPIHLLHIDLTTSRWPTLKEVFRNTLAIVTVLFLQNNAKFLHDPFSISKPFGRWTELFGDWTKTEFTGLVLIWMMAVGVQSILWLLNRKRSTSWRHLLVPSLALIILYGNPFYPSMAVGLVFLGLIGLWLSSFARFDVWERLFAPSIHDDDPFVKLDNLKWKATAVIGAGWIVFIWAILLPLVWDYNPLYALIAMSAAAYLPIPLIPHVAAVLVQTVFSRRIAGREARLEVRTWLDAQNYFPDIFERELIREELRRDDKMKPLSAAEFEERVERELQWRTWQYLMILRDQFLNHHISRKDVDVALQRAHPLLRQVALGEKSTSMAELLYELEELGHAAALSGGLQLPEEVADFEGNESLRLWINKFSRGDRPVMPFSLEEVDATNVTAWGSVEPWRIRLRALLEDKDEETNHVAIATVLQQLAHGYPGAWKNFIQEVESRFPTQGDAIEWLKGYANWEVKARITLDDKVNIPFRLFMQKRPPPDLVKTIEDFANERMSGVSRTVKDFHRLYRINQEYYDYLSPRKRGEEMKDYLARRDAWVKSHTRVTVKYEQQKKAVQPLFNKMLRRLIQRFDDLQRAEADGNNAEATKIEKELSDMLGSFPIPKEPAARKGFGEYLKKIPELLAEDPDLPVESLYEPEILRSGARAKMAGLTPGEADVFMKQVDRMFDALLDVVETYEKGKEKADADWPAWVAAIGMNVESTPLRDGIQAVADARRYRDKEPIYLFFGSGRPGVIRTDSKFEEAAFGLRLLIPSGVSWAADGSMSIDRHELRETARLQQEFRKNPSLGYLNVAQGDSNEFYSVNTRYAPAGENVWINDGLRTTRAGTYWRATMYAPGFYEWESTLEAGYAVAEDTEINAQFKAKGGQGRLAEYAKMRFARIATFHGTTNIRIRYARQSIRLLLENSTRNLLFNENIPASERLDELFALIFYLRKLNVLAVISAIIFTVITFPFFSVFPRLVMPALLLPIVVGAIVGFITYLIGPAGLRNRPHNFLWRWLKKDSLKKILSRPDRSSRPDTVRWRYVAMLMTGLSFAASFFLVMFTPGIEDRQILNTGLAWLALPFIISAATFTEDKVFQSTIRYNERGGIKGGFKRFIQDFPWLFAIYTFLIASDYSDGALEGVKKFASFLGFRASRSPLLARASTEAIYLRNKRAIQRGVMLITMSVAGLLFNFYPYTLLISGTFLLAALSFIVTPWVLNPDKSRVLMAANGFKDSVQGVEWAVHDLLRDAKEGLFRPFRYRFRPDSRQKEFQDLHAEFDKELRAQLRDPKGEDAAAYNQLDIELAPKDFAGVARIYAGLRYGLKHTRKIEDLYRRLLANHNYRGFINYFFARRPQEMKAEHLRRLAATYLFPIGVVLYAVAVFGSLWSLLDILMVPVAFALWLGPSYLIFRLTRLQQARRMVLMSLLAGGLALYTVAVYGFTPSLWEFLMVPTAFAFGLVVSYFIIRHLLRFIGKYIGSTWAYLGKGLRWALFVALVGFPVFASNTSFYWPTLSDGWSFLYWPFLSYWLSLAVLYSVTVVAGFVRSKTPKGYPYQRKLPNLLVVMYLLIPPLSDNLFYLGLVVFVTGLTWLTRNKKPSATSVDPSTPVVPVSPSPMPMAAAFVSPLLIHYAFGLNPWLGILVSLIFVVSVGWIFYQWKNRKKAPPKAPSPLAGEGGGGGGDLQRNLGNVGGPEDLRRYTDWFQKVVGQGNPAQVRSMATQLAQAYLRELQTLAPDDADSLKLLQEGYERLRTAYPDPSDPDLARLDTEIRWLLDALRPLRQEGRRHTHPHRSLAQAA